jgi:hypothetical protein
MVVVPVSEEIRGRVVDPLEFYAVDGGSEYTHVHYFAVCTGDASSLFDGITGSAGFTGHGLVIDLQLEF